MARISNRDASNYVRRRQEFKGSNLFGTSLGERYVVYSYGAHWPLFVYDSGVWYENQDKYSQSTSRHLKQAHPAAATTKLPVNQMLSIAERGVVNHITEQLVA